MLGSIRLPVNMVKLAYVIQRLWSHRVIKQMIQRWNDWMQVIYSVSYGRYSDRGRCEVAVFLTIAWL
jgi:hypothetical protein